MNRRRIDDETLRLVRRLGFSAAAFAVGAALFAASTGDVWLALRISSWGTGWAVTWRLADALLRDDEPTNTTETRRSR